VRGDRRGWGRSLFNIGMLALAVLSVVLTVVLAPRLARRTFLVSTEQAISLLAEDPIFDDITLFYKGTAIPNLSKFVFRAANTGREPILEEEVKQPPTVEFVGDGEVILARTIDRHPSNLAEELAVSLNSDGVSILFPLMNPGDFVRFCVYYAGKLAEEPHASGRIAGVTEIKQVSLVDRESPVRESTVRWWEILFWAIAGICLVLGAPSMISEFVQRRHLRLSISDDPSLLQSLHTGEDFAAFVRSKMGFLLHGTRDKILQKLASSDLSNPDEQERVRETLIKHVLTDTSTENGILGFLILALPGLVLLILRFV